MTAWRRTSASTRLTEVRCNFGPQSAGATIRGEGLNNGQMVTFTVDVVDNGEAGSLVVIGIAAGRGGGGEAPETKDVKSPACAGPIKSVDRPDAVPANLLPPGTVLTSRANLPQKGTLVTGVIPLEFRRAVDFYVTGLPAAGYQLGAGDAEQDEAEALFLGERISGKWKVNGILNCPDAVTLTLLVNS